MDYYKILNEKEYHHGLQYKFGLNVDPKEFNPSGSCSPGGIYFSREDILAFLDYGPWIRKVTLPDDVRVYENPGEPRKCKANKVILGKKEKITVKVIKRLIDEGADPKANNNYPLMWAATNGHYGIVKLLLQYTDTKTYFNDALNRATQNGYLDIVKLLLPLSDPKAYDSCALRNAALNGHLKIVKLLLPYSDPKACDSYALRYAALNGHLEIVKLLIPVSDPKANYSEALRFTAKYGYLKIVKLLLPLSDPKAKNSYALRWAAENGHLDIVKLLIPVSEIDDYVIEYCRRYCENQEIHDLIKASKKGNLNGLL